MQIYYMKKEKIPIPVSTVVLMIVTITYKLVLVVIGIGILIFGQGFLHRYLEGILPVYYLGLGLNVFCVVFMTVLVFHPVLTKEILKKGVHLLEKLRQKTVTPHGYGIGLLNIEKRLEFAFGKEAGLELYNEDGMATARITIPCRVS